MSAVLVLALSATTYLLGAPLAWRTILVVAVFVLSGLAGFIWSAQPASRHRDQKWDQKWGHSSFSEYRFGRYWCMTPILP